MGRRLHLHKLDGDHEGLLWVRPVQLLGSVADLGKAGGQVHSRRAVLGQFTQGHQLGDGGVCRKEGSRLAKSMLSLPTSICKHPELIQPASTELGRGRQGEQAGLCPAPPGCRDQHVNKARPAPNITGGSILHSAGLESTAQSWLTASARATRLAELRATPRNVGLCP